MHASALQGSRSTSYLGGEECGEIEGRLANLDVAALRLGLGSLVEVGDHAEAAPAVLDERADGLPPSALRVLRRVLRRHLEGLEEIHGLFP